MKFNPMERLTLAALLGGLQNGVSGDQAMPLLQSILAQRQGRVDARRAMAQDMQQTLLGIAGTASGPNASQAYLQSLIDSNYIKPRMGERLTDFNTALYPSGGQSPLYGITGQAAADSGIPEAEPISGFTDSELSRYFRAPGASGNTALGIKITSFVAQGKTDPNEIYDALTKLPDETGYFALMEPAAARTAIMNILTRNNLIPPAPAPWQPPAAGAGAAVPPQQIPYMGAGGNYGAAPAPPVASPYMGAGGPYGYRG